MANLQIMPPLVSLSMPLVPHSWLTTVSPSTWPSTPLMPCFWCTTTHPSMWPTAPLRHGNRWRCTVTTSNPNGHSLLTPIFVTIAHTHPGCSLSHPKTQFNASSTPIVVDFLCCIFSCYYYCTRSFYHNSQVSTTMKYAILFYIIT